MKNLILLFTLIISLTSISQVNEFGFFSGAGYYIGDLNKSHFSQQDLCFGLVYKTDFPNERVSLRVHLMYNNLKASDIKSGIESQIYRNLEFKSEVIEFGPIIEIDFFNFHPGQNHTDQPDFGSPYFFAGINYMRMNPKGKSGGEWVELQPLGTEGQGTILKDINGIVEKYSRNQIVIPFGLGLKMNITHHLSFSLEYGMRKTFTDYFDDVSGLYPDLAVLAAVNPEAAQMSDKSKFPQGLNDSSYGLQRGDASNKDWYAVSGIILTYEFFKDVVCPKW
jgi:opacity protein-like surface antigen